MLKLQSTNFANFKKLWFVSSTRLYLTEYSVSTDTPYICIIHVRTYVSYMCAELYEVTRSCISYVSIQSQVSCKYRVYVS